MMDAATLFGLCAAALVGFGLYGVITNPQPLRKILAFNLIGNGVFLLFGAIARRAGAGFGGDPVPQGLLITGIVVAFSATALAVALLLRLFQATGSATLAGDQPAKGKAVPAMPRCVFRAGMTDDPRRTAARAGGAGPVCGGASRTRSRRTPRPARRARHLARRGSGSPSPSPTRWSDPAIL